MVSYLLYNTNKREQFIYTKGVLFEYEYIAKHYIFNILL